MWGFADLGKGHQGNYALGHALAACAQKVGGTVVGEVGEGPKAGACCAVQVQGAQSAYRVLVKLRSAICDGAYC